MSENLDMSTLSPATTLLVKSEKMLQFVGNLSESSCKTAMQRGKGLENQNNKSSSHYSPKNNQEILSYVYKKLRNTLIGIFVQAESNNIFPYLQASIPQKVQCQCPKVTVSE